MAGFTTWMRRILCIFTCFCLKKKDGDESEDQPDQAEHENKDYGTDGNTSDDVTGDYFFNRFDNITGNHPGIPQTFLTEEQAKDKDLTECVRSLHSSNDDIAETPDLKPSDVKKAKSFEVFEPEIIMSSTTHENDKKYDEKCDGDSAQTSGKHLEIEDLTLKNDILDTVQLLLTKVEVNIKSEMKLIKRMDGTDEYQEIKPDTLIMIGGQEFHTHKDILCAEYFKEALSGNRNKQIVFHMNPKFVSPNVFQCLLTFLYSGVMSISCHQMRDLYRAAHYLGMKRVIQKCKEMFDISSNNIKNILNMYATASFLELHTAKKRVLKLMAANFESVIMEKDFLGFTKEQIIELFMEDTIGARSEIVVFLTALKWVNHNYLEREEYAFDILQCVRFANMTLEEAIACLHPPLLPGLMEKQEIRTLVLNGICYISSKIQKQERFFSNMKSEHRNLLLIGRPLELWNTSAFCPKWTQDRAATKIQAAFRGFKVRKEISECSNWKLRMWYTSYTLKQEMREMQKEVDQKRFSQIESIKVPPTLIKISSVRNYKDFLKSKHERKPLNVMNLE